MDDAGVVKYDNNTGLVQTVDFFTPVVDEPRDFGRIAVANAVSDIYAMGGTPISALNIVGFPDGKLSLDILGDILAAGAEWAARLGVPIIGGHSIKSDEPFYGLAVTGKIKLDAIMMNTGCRPGDSLYLTKPLGSGLITTALKLGKVPEDVVAKAIEIMAEPNREASEAAVGIGIKAATDVTGYGFLGHLLEMMIASKTSAIVHYSRVPLMDGVADLAQLGTFPGGSISNFKFVSKHAAWDGALSEIERKILCDAQTSGGLILSVPKAKEKALADELARRKVMVTKVGEVVERHEWHLKIDRN